MQQLKLCIKGAQLLNIFQRRVAYKPYEYPEIDEYAEEIMKIHWLATKFHFLSDIQNYKVDLNEVERNAVKNAMLAISQIEVSVKKFWAKIGDRFPKPEVDQVGILFGANEVNHAKAYSHLLNVLGLNDDFATVVENPVIKGRVEYLTKYLKNADSQTNEEFTSTLALFTLFIENVSLFSQFLILKSFMRAKNWLKDIDNVVDYTIQEETLHFLFGVKLIEIIKIEHPDWFGEEFYAKLYRAAKKAFKAESEIVNWIFEKGELSWLSKAAVIEFLKDRFNQSLQAVGGESMFPVDTSILNETIWFYEEFKGKIGFDFFHTKGTSYTKTQVNPEDLF